MKTPRALTGHQSSVVSRESPPLPVPSAPPPPPRLLHDLHYCYLPLRRGNSRAAEERARMPPSLEKKAAQLEQQLTIQSKNFASVLAELDGKKAELAELQESVRREISARESVEERLAQAEGAAASARGEASIGATQLEQARVRHVVELRVLGEEHEAELREMAERREAELSEMSAKMEKLEELYVARDEECSWASAHGQEVASQLEEARCAAAEFSAMMVAANESTAKEIDQIKAAYAQAAEAEKAQHAREMSALKQEHAETITGLREGLREEQSASARREAAALEAERTQRSMEVSALKQEHEATVSILREQLGSRAAALSDLQETNSRTYETTIIFIIKKSIDGNNNHK
ncbi:MAG: hypothetical protein SGPRY_005966 [Prymnesium sp.]